jgi:SIR2-like domain
MARAHSDRPRIGPREWRGVLNPKDTWHTQSSSYLVTHRASESFIRRIQRERQRGYGFVPLIGAGFSAPSGAPLIEELRPYLQRCILLALGEDHLPPKWRAHWHPRTDQWPPFIDREFKRIAGSAEPWGKLLGQLRGLWPKSGTSRSAGRKAAILAEALGAGEEWRTALLFLSRLKHSERKSGVSSISLDSPQPELIDSCLREVLLNKSPSLNHKMLGVLAGVLRLNLLLTTNFDDLLERAFAQARNPLDVLEVHLHEGLPHWSAVSHVRSLVKLHGNRHALRADYSLDAEPSEHDKRTFLDYLVAGMHTARDRREPPAAFQNHLLVMGLGAREERTLGLIEYAWERLSPLGFQVFWVCYSDRDVDDVKQFTETRLLRKALERRTARARVQGPIVLRHPHQGLLLLQLYQTIRRNLPPFGAIFPSVSRLPLPPLSSSKLDHAAIDFGEGILGRLEFFQSEEGCKELKFIVATSEPGVQGLTSICGEVFRRVEGRHIALWLDMNDISSTDDLFEVLLETAYVRLGQENWVPTHYETDNAYRSAEIERLILSGEQHWVIFLNARETPGANTRTYDASDVNGWLDTAQRTFPREDLDDHSDCASDFLKLIGQLCGPAIARISVVLLCRANEHSKGLRTILGPASEKPRLFPLKNEPGTPAFSEHEVVAKAIHWTKGDKARQRFLHALVLMQRPRLMATIWSDAVSLPPTPKSLAGGGLEEETPEAERRRLAWLSELESRGLIRRKSGGFIWMHSPSRARLRRVLWREEPLPEDGTEINQAARAILARWEAVADEAEIHSRIARWYEKVLDASEAPGAAFEAAYHLCLAAARHLERPDNSEALSAAQQSIDAASSLLRANDFLIQTRGYARGSCRRLNHIRRALCGKLRFLEGSPVAAAVNRLQLTCTELMRMIAREVGEDKKAFLRHQQCADLRSKRPLQDEVLRHTGEHALSRGLLAAIANPDDPHAAAEWVRWWRWSAMLGLSSRSYHAARRSLYKAFECLIRPLEYPERDAPADLDTLEAALNRSRSQEFRLEALRVIEQYVALRLIDYGLDRRRSFAPIVDDTNPAPRPARDQIRDIELHVALGHRLVAKIRSGDLSADSRDLMAVSWCECRLLIHQSVCASRRFQFMPQGEDAIGSVMGLLGDAEASLRISDPRRYRSELAIVELHRAETRTQRAEAVAVYGPSVVGGRHRGIQFIELCAHLERRSLECASEEELREVLRHEFPQRHDPNLLRVRSLVSDGVRFLERARPILRERRRNMWWTTWYFERYLRLIAMSVWACVFDQGSPIPFLGLEAAASGTASIADEMLNDSLRMISVDAYRLATIIDAYGSCALALQARLIVESRVTELRFRRDTMHGNLTNALAQLSGARGRRNIPATLTRDDEDTRVDPRIAPYIDAVETRAKDVLGCLQRNGAARLI